LTDSELEHAHQCDLSLTGAGLLPGLKVALGLFTGNREKAW
jgi:hypothetical protein